MGEARAAAASPDMTLVLRLSISQNVELLLQTLKRSIYQSLRFWNWFAVQDSGNSTHGMSSPWRWGLASWFLLYEPSNFQLEGPHSKQLCVIRTAILIGKVGLLDYCWERSLKPNRPTNHSSTLCPPQLSEYKEGFLKIFSLLSHAGKFPCGSWFSPDRRTVRQTEHEWKHCKNNWQMRLLRLRGE